MNEWIRGILWYVNYILTKFWRTPVKKSTYLDLLGICCWHRFFIKNTLYFYKTVCFITLNLVIKTRPLPTQPASFCLGLQTPFLPPAHSYLWRRIMHESLWDCRHSKLRFVKHCVERDEQLFPGGQRGLWSWNFQILNEPWVVVLVTPAWWPDSVVMSG